MQIGIGLPSTIAGIPDRRVVEWAQRAEERGFSGLATIDRIVYPSQDSLIALAAAAGATTRIGLATNILLGSVYPPALLAKATASLDQLSGGRLTLGIAAGGRADDFTVSGRDFHSRGRDLDHTLEVLHRAWRGEPVEGADRPVGPPAVHGSVPVLIGGTSDKAVGRVATWGAGWTAGGGGPEMAAPVVEKVRAAWRDAGRDGEPRLAALAYFSLGDDAAPDSRAYLLDYYSYAGEYAEAIASSALRTPTQIRDAVRAFADLGFSELYLDPTTAALDQVDRLADVVL
jgi:alkanesulfonate monooxygenase SsuD/methylene tetrahydromethanopterin reductase-like flavin-dependent oxidoreductase (luciferase family)